ncbi:MAG: rhomboid family intramembrane serine protease [Cyanobacteria bacterium HKST-UBA02]|nr:rhomboid family intramembrane serine protease [Cyanobacteria bacterium HKST-UBA02]
MIEQDMKSRAALCASAIVALNVLAFIYLRIAGGEEIASLINAWAFSPRTTIDLFKEGQIITALAIIEKSTFCHLTPAHLLSNMIPIYLFAVVIAREKSTGEFLKVYFLGGLMAALATTLLSFWQVIPINGASGAAAALYGYYAGLKLIPRTNQERLQALLMPVITFAFLAAGLALKLPVDSPAAAAYLFAVLLFCAGLFSGRIEELWLPAIALWVLGNTYDLFMTGLDIYATGSAHLLHLTGFASGLALCLKASAGERAA